MHRGVVSKHTPNFVIIGLSIPELELSGQFLHLPHFARATCHSGYPDGWVLVPLTVEGMWPSGPPSGVLVPIGGLCRCGSRRGAAGAEAPCLRCRPGWLRLTGGTGPVSLSQPGQQRRECEYSRQLSRMTRVNLILEAIVHHVSCYVTLEKAWFRRTL